MKFSIDIKRTDLEIIYEKVRYEKMLEKAKERLFVFADIKYNLETLDNCVIDEFYKKYKINLCNAVRKGNREYILDSIVSIFKESYNPEISENQQWKIAIEKALLSQ